MAKLFLLTCSPLTQPGSCSLPQAPAELQLALARLERTFPTQWVSFAFLPPTSLTYLPSRTHLPHRALLLPVTLANRHVRYQPRARLDRRHKLTPRPQLTVTTIEVVIRYVFNLAFMTCVTALPRTVMDSIGGDLDWTVMELELMTDGDWDWRIGAAYDRKRKNGHAVHGRVPALSDMTWTGEESKKTRGYHKDSTRGRHIRADGIYGRRHMSDYTWHTGMQLIPLVQDIFVPMLAVRISASFCLCRAAHAHP